MKELEEERLARAILESTNAPTIGKPAVSAAPAPTTPGYFASEENSPAIVAMIRNGAGAAAVWEAKQAEKSAEQLAKQISQAFEAANRC